VRKDQTKREKRSIPEKVSERERKFGHFNGAEASRIRSRGKDANPLPGAKVRGGERRILMAGGNSKRGKLHCAGNVTELSRGGQLFDGKREPLLLEGSYRLRKENWFFRGKDLIGSRHNAGRGKERNLQPRDPNLKNEVSEAYLATGGGRGGGSTGEKREPV